MLVSLNWIKKFTSIELDNESLIAKIGAQIAEVESVVDLSQKYSEIVIAEIVEKADHPDADKLGIYQINNGNEILQVVAGDKSLNVGDKIAHIAPGVTVPSTWGTSEPFVIEVRPLRGQNSNGMMGSAAELGFGDDHSQVLRLDTDKPAGTSLIEAYELDDLIIEIENKTLTHRPDCFGVIGFAREVAGVSGINFETPQWFNNATELQNSQNDSGLTVEIKTDDCARYVGIVMNNVSVGPSPIILQSYLYRVGVRPINNIVDITNYLMLETGQPLHAFDYDKTAERSTSGAKIVVRNPLTDEKLKLLDGREIQPHNNALLICTDKEAIALGGAMGGADTEIDDQTKKIIIESANFDLYNLRRTSMIHGVFSEAVTRFIRGQSPQQCLSVGLRAAAMASELSGAVMIGSPVDVYPAPSPAPKIETSSDFINSRLGSEYSKEQMSTVLESVEIAVEADDQKMTAVAPFWRRDLNIAEDIVEEVGRLIGYEMLETSLPERDLRPAKLDELQSLITAVREIMSTAGNNEVLTYNFVDQKVLQRANSDPNLAFRIRNSLSPKLELMRTSLMPSLIDKVHPNIKLGYQEFGLFEINKSHRNNSVDQGLPIEEHSLAYVYASDPRIKSHSQNGSPYYQAVYTLNYLLDELSINSTTLRDAGAVIDDWIAARIPTYQTGRVAAIMSGDLVVGIVGEIDSNVKKNFKLPDYTAGFELNIRKLVELRTSNSRYLPQLKFPGTQKDITFMVDESTQAKDVFDVIVGVIDAQADMQNAASIIDVYQREPGQKNLTYRLDLKHSEHTLTADEANELVDQVAEIAKKQFQAVRV
jgi:phenylalanyl-tRNA synthetase beta chain